MSTIPASLFVNVIPSVLPPVGDAIDLNGLVVTTSIRVPLGLVYGFASGAAVTAFFGTGSKEDIIANGGAGKGSGYFSGDDNSTKLPGQLLFTQYNETAAAAYLWGGNAGAALTLAQLQALSGSLTVVMDGYPHVITSISFSAINSFSAAAAAIQAAFTDPTESSFTASIGATATGTGSGTNLTLSSVVGLVSPGDVVAGVGVPVGTKIVSGPGGNGVYVTDQATTAIAASIIITSTVLDVTVDTDHTIAIGQTVVGAGVTGSPVITAQLTGTSGQIGTYRISGTPQQVASEAMTGIATAPLVTFDSQSGAFVITSGITGVASTSAFATGTLAIPLLLTLATGAVLSQGAAAATPAGIMNGVISVTKNWFAYGTSFDPDHGAGSTVKQAFAAWKNGNGVLNNFMYVCFDTDVLARSNPPQAGTLGQILKSNGDSGTLLISELSDLNQMQFGLAIGASIDFDQVNGRTDYAFRSQAGLVADVTTEQAAVNLGGNPQVVGDFGNGYNYYGAVGAANAGFLWFQRGTVTGKFRWADSYANQVWMNNQFQLALAQLATNSKSIPFNPAGANLIEAAMADPIQAAGTFGVFAPGTISNAQIAEVNAAAGANIAPSLQTQGYYLQVLQQSSAVRLNRGPWAITFWYLDRGSVQSFSVSSVAVQ